MPTSAAGVPAAGGCGVTVTSKEPVARGIEEREGGTEADVASLPRECELAMGARRIHRRP